MKIKHSWTKFPILIGSIVLILLALSISPTQLVDAAATIVEVDANPAPSGLYGATQVNSAGLVVVAFYAQEYKELRLATCNDVNCSNPATSVVATEVNIGSLVSLAVGSSGNPVISFFDFGLGGSGDSLKVAVCGNPTCTAGNVVTVTDSGGGIGRYNSLVLTSSNIPVIAYTDATNNDLKIAVCGNATCSAGNIITTVDSVGNTGYFPSLKLSSSGFPVISYFDITNTDLRLAVCGNSTCTSGNTLTTLDASGTGYNGENSSLALNNSGFPVISYSGDTPENLKLIVCGNATCSSGNTVTVIETTTNRIDHTALRLNSGGFPVMAYYSVDQTGTSILTVAICSNLTCTLRTRTTVHIESDNGDDTLALSLTSDDRPIVAFPRDLPLAFSLAVCLDSSCLNVITKDVTVHHDVGWHNDLALNSNGFPVMSYKDTGNGTLKVAICGDAMCTNKILTTVDDIGRSARFTSIAVNSAGNPVIAYMGQGVLKVAVCGNATCTSGNVINDVVASGNPGSYNTIDMLLTNNNIPLIAFTTDENLYFVACGNTVCSNSNSVTLVDPLGNPGTIYQRPVSLALNSNNLPTIAYYGMGRVKLAVCGNISCSGGSIINEVGPGARFISMRLNANGNPVIAYESQSLHLTVCGNPTCANGNITTIVDSTNQPTGILASLSLQNGINPIIAYFGGGNLKAAVCSNPTCTNKAFVSITSDLDGGAGISSLLQSNGRYLLSFQNAYYDDLMLYINDNIIPLSTATPTITNTSIPSSPDTIGVYKDGTFYLRNANNTGSADITATFGGDPSDLPVAGDWNGDSRDTIGVYRSSTGVYFLSDSNTAPTANYSLVFGNPGDTPFAGKWTADMTHDGVGVYRNANGILYKKKQLTTGFSDYFAVFGNPGDRGIAGDWNTNGLDSVGIYRSSNQQWYLTNNNEPSGITFSDINFFWDVSTELPFVGDWDGDRDSTPGYLTSTGLFVLHSANATEGADIMFVFGPSESKPIAGKWTAPSTQPRVIVAQPPAAFGSNAQNGDAD